MRNTDYVSYVSCMLHAFVSCGSPYGKFMNTPQSGVGVSTKPCFMNSAFRYIYTLASQLYGHTYTLTEV